MTRPCRTFPDGPGSRVHCLYIYRRLPHLGAIARLRTKPSVTVNITRVVGRCSPFGAHEGACRFDQTPSPSTILGSHDTSLPISGGTEGLHPASMCHPRSELS